MDDVASLTGAQVVLLAASLASDSNIKGLTALTQARQDVLHEELLLRILLTLLPETLDPTAYTGFLQSLSNLSSITVPDDAALGLAAVKDLSEHDARKQLRRLHLLPLDHPSVPRVATGDLLSSFIIHRAHRIDSETGLLDFLTSLITPFLSRSQYLRVWYTTTCLPLLRLEYDYGAQEDKTTTLEVFEHLHGRVGLELLLARAAEQADQEATPNALGRNLRGIVAPWVYGSRQRKRRRTAADSSASSAPGTDLLNAEYPSNNIVEDWQPAFHWILSSVPTNFTQSAKVIEEWDGPADVDFGGYEDNSDAFIREGPSMKDLQLRYYQTALAIAYTVDGADNATITTIHAILVRLADLLNFDPPRELTFDLEFFPTTQSKSLSLNDLPKLLLQAEDLMTPDHFLTTPNQESFLLLQMFIFSAHLLGTLGHSMSIVQLTKLRFWSDAEEQLTFVLRLLRHLANGPRKNQEQWAHARKAVLWLWSWASPSEPEIDAQGEGCFGKIGKEVLEKELLKTLLMSAAYPLIISIYLGYGTCPLSNNDVEAVVLAQIHEYYDTATNGNKTRGGMKKALELLTTFRSYFPQSDELRRAKHLIDATHALSFYSLTLQNGVPFQPVNIRVSEDPIILLSKVLAQNARSYTKVDDLVSIGHNLIRANTSQVSDDELRSTDNRITAMAIEAALAEDDFETAYSYVINRLPHAQTPQAETQQAPSADEDDISWRAAFHAGTRMPATSESSTRRLEQYLELLSHTLLLAPAATLPEILTAWQHAESALLDRLAEEQAEASALDSAADGSASKSANDSSRTDTRLPPGSFNTIPDPTLISQPQRKIFGSAAASNTSNASRPARSRAGQAQELERMGLVDVFRGSWRAVNRSASAGATNTSTIARLAPASTTTTTSGAGGADGGAGEDEEDKEDMGERGWEGEQRVRKRDAVANAVTGGLASGIGWVLGAQPVRE